jgi:hypothetical protein
MGRECRRVPKDWDHPRDDHGALIPMHDEFPYNDSEVSEGLADGWLDGGPPHYGMPIMPDWPESERTHYQMYETCTEGTPISPVCETPEELARWCADNGASAFADMTASYEHWLGVARGGWAPSMVIGGGRMMSGVEAMGSSTEPGRDASDDD